MTDHTPSGDKGRGSHLLRVRGLGFGYHRPLFAGVSFSIAPGDLCLVSGGNGTGKSTLLSILAGLLAPQQGAYSFGDDARGAGRAEYLQAENNGLFCKMDAVQNLRYWASLRGVHLDDETIFTELERWGLNHPLIRRGFPVEKFSTGMKRRLALARVALSQTKLWILDEPFYGLDQRALGIFQLMLRDHLASGGAALVVSHDLAPLEKHDHQTIQLESFKDGVR